MSATLSDQVWSRAWPGPAATSQGLGGLGAGMHTKQLELLRQVVPKASRIAMLHNPSFSLHALYRTEVELAARSLGVTLRPIEPRSPDHIDPAFATLAREPVDALQIVGQPFLFAQGARIAKRAIEQRLPAVIAFQEVARDGILMSCTALDQPFGSTAIGPGAAGCWRALGVTYPLLSRIASSSDPRAGLQSSRVHPFRLVTFEANARSEFDFALGGSRVDAHVGRRTSSFLG